ncbi:odorant receptor 13a-like [Linepithema humile]|uniref:odorant receptor 13a-like n=1 Tax=Linepithema humile TaxID=83485 RepID=UPI00351F18FF
MVSCKTWNKEMSYEFSLYKPIMWPIGSWPLDHGKNFAKYRALFVITTQAIMIVCLSLYINHRDDDTLDMLVDHLMLIACGVLTILKVFLIRLHRDDLLKNLCNAASDWTYITNRDHRQVMLRYTKLGRFVFFFQMCSSYIVLIPLIAGSFLSFVTQPTSWNVTSNTRSEEETRVVELPQEMICPFDAQIVCFGIYILQTVQLISTSTGNVGTDVFVFAVCMHLCGQLEILASELLRFHEGKENNSWARAKMITLIDRHCLLLNLAKNISDTLDIILIVQLVVHASLICLIGLQLIWSLAMSDFVLVVRSILSFNILMIQIFLYSYMGETLSFRAQAISRAIYLSKWYDLPANIIRDLYFVIARANVPICITVGKFFNMDLNSFKNILKASASYFSVLQIMLME